MPGIPSVVAPGSKPERPPTDASSPKDAPAMLPLGIAWSMGNMLSVCGEGADGSSPPAPLGDWLNAPPIAAIDSNPSGLSPNIPGVSVMAPSVPDWLFRGFGAPYR